MSARNTGCDAFAKDVLRSVVAEICLTEFETAEQRALSTLVGIISEYLEQTARTAKLFSERVARRQVVTAKDATAAVNASKLVDVNDLHRVCDDVVYDLTCIEGVPEFPTPGPGFPPIDPESKSRRVPGLPLLFPPLPPEHTYKSTLKAASRIGTKPGMHKVTAIPEAGTSGGIKEVLVRLHKAEIEGTSI